jgi:hypothetical protein
MSSVTVDKFDRLINSNPPLVGQGSGSKSEPEPIRRVWNMHDFQFLTVCVRKAILLTNVRARCEDSPIPPREVIHVFQLNKCFCENIRTGTIKSI